MKTLIAIGVFTSLLVCSCERGVTDGQSLRKARDRAEFVLLCNPDCTGKEVKFSLDRPLYVKKGARVPWKPGELISAPGFEVKPNLAHPDQSVMFYEEVRGSLIAVEIYYVYSGDVPGTEMDLADLITELKK